jgi:hypothetical protein
MRWTMLALCAVIGCDNRPHSNPKDDGDVGGVEDDDDGGGTDVDDLAPALTLDRPAFYTDGDTVEVTGTVTDDGALEGVEVAGVPAEIDDAGAWSATLPLDTDWDVVEAVATDVSGNQAALQAQVARATESTAPLVAGADTVVGPAGRTTLAAWIAPYAEAASYGPPAEQLAQGVCDPCPLGIECGEENVTETISTTGDWTLRFTAGLDTTAGRLDVDLAGVEVDWELRVTAVNGRGYDRDYSATLTSTLAGGAPTTACTGLGLDTAFDASSHAWSLDADPGLICFDIDDLTGPADALYAPVVPPALSGAVCAWADWLEPALSTDMPGATLDYATSADADGIVLRWDARPDAPPAWQALDPGSPVQADGIDVALFDPLIGAVLDAAVDAALPATVSVDLGGGDSGSVELRRIAPDTSSLAHVGGVEGLALVSPIAYEITGPAGLCESGHLIPGPVALGADGADGAWQLSLDTLEARGSDVADTCGLDGARLGVLTAALQGALADTSLSWTPNEGLEEAGATLSWSAAQGAYVVEITDAGPPSVSEE